MKLSRRSQSNSLAFLDVMACGLGAAVLIFLIIKHHTDTGTEPALEDAVVADAELLSTLTAEKQQLTQQIEQATRQLALQEEQVKANQKRRTEIGAKQAELDSLNRQTEQEHARKESLEAEIVAIEPHQSEDIVEDPKIGEEEYLLGMKVEGRRIAILIDRSASMTDELLINIISRKVRSGADKKNGPKWQRTLRTARWLLNRVPKNSSVAVVVFNDKANILNRGRWANRKDPGKIAAVLDEIDGLVPTGATNLEAGLRVLGRLSPVATDIYIVTDGLPTQSVTTPNLLSKCRWKASVVSGNCRRILFDTSIANSTQSEGKKVNVILLPLEGDPEAAPLFWKWTALTGGLLLVPAAGWP